MKILVLDKDVKERSVIQQALQQDGHEIISAEDTETAMWILQQGEIRFILADRVTTDIDEKQFIQRVRAAKAPYYIYILLIASKVQESDLTAARPGADDYLHKPFSPIELKSRVHIGQRILSLGDNLVQAKGTLDNTAMFDTLTNVLNQKAFIALSRGELERARRGQSPFSLIALEIDNFESINSEHGENIGNDVLNVMARAIREKSRPYDGLGRYEDNMFLIALPGVIGQDAEKVADRIIKGILNTTISLLDGRELKIGVSAGIVSSIRITAATEMDTLLEQVKLAVGQARREGGNRSYMVFI